ncbi:MAG: hypothetical protein AUK63_149 [bacterium P3]|nr:MAG: hypothetical protein AUK63_149 [bacterium P3]
MLYHEIVEHRRKFYHVGYVDYDKELPANIQIVPSDELKSAYEADYNEMKESFIYGDALDFTELMKKLTEIESRFRSIS